MACSHATTCPLHTHLRGSLAAWRVEYCDSDQGWANCARYQRSLEGEPMPLALLPNGKLIAIIDDGSAKEATSARSSRSGGSEHTNAQPVAVLTDNAAEAVSDAESEALLLQASSGKSSLWRRFSRIFGLAS